MLLKHVRDSELDESLEGRLSVDPSEDNLRRALERNPNHAGAVTGMPIVMMDTGRLAEALRWARRTVALEPTYAPHYGRIGRILDCLGAEASSVRWFNRQLALAPDDSVSYGDFVYFHLYRGRTGLAREYLEEMRDVAPEAPETFLRRYDLALAGGDLEAALRFHEAWYERQSREWMPALGSLERAVDRGWAEIQWLKRHPIFEPVRDDARYAELVVRLEEELAGLREASGADTLRPPGHTGDLANSAGPPP